ncbi:transposase [Streptomyces xanthophaeus]|uniref:transposase n=1 Tax=Streptomyces xanthophaeus TaxID=67385 RepID=UPI00099B69C5
MPTSTRAGPEKGLRSPALGRSRGGLTSRIHRACDGTGRPLTFVLTAGNTNDCTQFTAEMDVVRAPRIGPGRPRVWPDRVIGDKGYSSKAIRNWLRRRGAAASRTRSRWGLTRSPIGPGEAAGKAAGEAGRRPSASRSTWTATCWNGAPPACSGAGEPARAPRWERRYDDKECGAFGGRVSVWCEFCWRRAKEKASQMPFCSKRTSSVGHGWMVIWVRCIRSWCGGRRKSSEWRAPTLACGPWPPFHSRRNDFEPTRSRPCQLVRHRPRRQCPGARTDG